MELCIGSKKIDCSKRTLVMGIVNVTPDSFSDGGMYFSVEGAAAHARAMIEDGADIIDIGGESTRPKGAYGSSPSHVSAGEELDRILPVLKELRNAGDFLLSVDTYKSDVAEAALLAGADIINDVSGLKRSGPEMAKVVKEFSAGIVLMHSRGTPETMPTLTEYADVARDVMTELRESLKLATEAGIEEEQIVIDPGLGFAKTGGQNLEILKKINVFHELGFPLLAGPSQKTFIGEVTGREVKDRSFGTAACVAACVRAGVQILRVHEVGAMRDVIRMTEAVK